MPGEFGFDIFDLGTELLRFIALRARLWMTFSVSSQPSAGLPSEFSSALPSSSELSFEEVSLEVVCACSVAVGSAGAAELRGTGAASKTTVTANVASFGRDSQPPPPPPPPPSDSPAVSSEDSTPTRVKVLR